MSKKMLIIAGIAFLFLIVGTGIAFYVLYGKISTAEREAPPFVETDEKQVLSKENQTTFPLKTFVVNLADAGGKRYLRISMVLELNSATPELTSELKAKLPHVNDKLLMILPSKTFDDIRTFQGKMALKEEITQELNSLLKFGKISNVYFEEFVIQ
jgi:flagellar FliL protein